MAMIDFVVKWTNSLVKGVRIEFIILMFVLIHVGIFCALYFAYNKTKANSRSDFKGKLE